MPRTPKELVRTQLNANLDAYAHYLTSTRYGRKRKVRSSTVRTYRNRLRAIMEWAGTAEPTVAQAQAYLAFMSNGYKVARTNEPPSDSTKRAAFHCVKAWFEFQRKPLTEKQEEAFLVPPMPRIVREMPLDLDRIRLLLSRIPDRRRYALIRTLLSTGIRRSELAALKVHHVDFEGRRLWVPEIGEDGRAAAKGGNGGWVGITAVALDAIREHLDSRRIGADGELPLFESLLTKGHLTPDAISDLVANLTTSILGERITPHVLRHAFASHAAAGDAENGRPPMPIVALQRQLRHKQAQSTLRYLHAVENHQAAFERSAPTF